MSLCLENGGYNVRLLVSLLVSGDDDDNHTVDNSVVFVNRIHPIVTKCATSTHFGINK